MNDFKSNTGIFILLAGVLLLCLYGFGIINILTNLLLLTGILLIFTGFLVYIFMNKKRKK